MDSLEIQKNELISLIAEERSKACNKFSPGDIKRFLEQGQGILGKAFREQKILIDTFVKRVTVNAGDIIVELIVDTNKSQNNTDVAVNSGGGGN